MFIGCISLKKVIKIGFNAEEKYIYGLKSKGRKNIRIPQEVTHSHTCRNTVELLQYRLNIPKQTVDFPAEE